MSQQPLRLDVAFLPSELPPDCDVAIVVDALRATSTVATMFSVGLPEVVCAAEIDLAQALAREHGYLLCGEVEGLAPDGFDFGNSPVELQAAEAVPSARGAVLFTTNGTAALAGCPATVVLAGSLLNADAAAAALVRVAPGGGRAAIVCAGESGGARFALEDAYAAGIIARRIASRCSRAGLELMPADSVRAAEHLVAGYKSAEEAFADSEHGRVLLDLLPDDVAFCAGGGLTCVPMVTERRPGYCVLRALAP
jgi:2-phosphosulfolactate phosphatase